MSMLAQALSDSQDSGHQNTGGHQSTGQGGPETDAVRLKLFAPKEELPASMRCRPLRELSDAVERHNIPIRHAFSELRDYHPSIPVSSLLCNLERAPTSEWPELAVRLTDVIHEHLDRQIDRALRIGFIDGLHYQQFRQGPWDVLDRIEECRDVLKQLTQVDRVAAVVAEYRALGRGGAFVAFLRQLPEVACGDLPAPARICLERAEEALPEYRNAARSLAVARHLRLYDNPGSGSGAETEARIRTIRGIKDEREFLKAAREVTEDIQCDTESRAVISSAVQLKVISPEKGEGLMRIPFDKRLAAVAEENLFNRMIQARSKSTPVQSPSTPTISEKAPDPAPEPAAAPSNPASVTRVSGLGARILGWLGV